MAGKNLAIPQVQITSQGFPCNAGFVVIVTGVVDGVKKELFAGIRHECEFSVNFQSPNSHSINAASLSVILMDVGSGKRHEQVIYEKEIPANTNVKLDMKVIQETVASDVAIPTMLAAAHVAAFIPEPSFNENGGEGEERIRNAIPVTLKRTDAEETYEKLLWEVIKERVGAISFDTYSHYMNNIFCKNHSLPERGGCDDDGFNKDMNIMKISIQGSNAYDALKIATECFLSHEAGVVNSTDVGKRSFCWDSLSEIANNKKYIGKLRDSYLLNLMQDGDYKLPLPYMELIRQKLGDLTLKSGASLGFAVDHDKEEPCYGISLSRAACPTMIELIWSYWMEESMLVQTINAISRRFQNVRAGRNDPLARMEIDPLRPMNNLLWGYIQDEPARLSLVRRAYEYDHHYGFSLAGKAVPKTKTADSRSRFLAAFHQLLNLAHRFFREDDDTTIYADAFPLLNALREVHLILAEGAHNQYGDLPWVARKEMLMMQWMLARPEMREFIGGRIMVPQKEIWMDRVDGMKRLQGWSSTSTTHFVDLATAGEPLLLSIRFASWSQITEPKIAASWARFWRSDIQRYAHAYRAATGVDLSDAATTVRAEAVDATPPSRWLLQREAS